MRNPFRYFNSSPEVIRLTVMMYVRYPLSLRQVEDLLFERGIDVCFETVQHNQSTTFAIRQSSHLSFQKP
jgi:transposase-like protein